MAETQQLPQLPKDIGDALEQQFDARLVTICNSRGQISSFRTGGTSPAPGDVNLDQTSLQNVTYCHGSSSGTASAQSTCIICTNVNGVWFCISFPC